MSQAETPEPVTPSVQEIELGTADAPAPDVEVVPADESPAPTATAEATPGAEENLEPVEPADQSAPASDAPEEIEPQPTPTPTQPAPETPSESTDPAPAPLSELEPDQPLPLPAGSQTLVLDETQTIGFSSAGISWVGEAPLNGVALQIRVKDAQTGEWSEWTDLSVNRSVVSNPDMPDLRQGTDPYWFGTSQGIEVAVTILPGTEISDLKITLIDPKKVEQDTVTQPSSTGGAGAAVPMPAIHTRAQWGADESKMGWTHQYMPTIKAATLHHSADGNNYSQADVPGMMRSIYHYQAVTLGWGDIGYNVVVDKFGRAWEGRSGGLNTAVVGAHAGGFNQSTFGVSMLGNYDLVNVPASTREMVAQLIAWKLGQYGVNPQGSVQLTQVGGAGTTARWTPGTKVTMPTIFGHRDVGRTACPGQYGYAALPGIRSRAAQLMDQYGPRAPIGNYESASASGDTVKVTGWTLDKDSPSTSGHVAVYRNGVGISWFAVGRLRADVNSVHGVSGNHGFNISLAKQPAGTHSYCVFAIDNELLMTNPLLGCRSVTVTPPGGTAPIGNVDSASASGKTVRLTGWTLDHDSPTVSGHVAVYRDGVGISWFGVDRLRADVNAAYGVSGDHGFNISLPGQPVGTHSYCIMAIDNERVTTNPLLACRTVVVV